jgi:D-alanyl-D-alanine dipeptidase
MPHPVKIHALVLLVLMFSGLSSCDQHSDMEAKLSSEEMGMNQEENLPVKDDIDLDAKMARVGLIDVSELDSTIWFELKYLGTDNFMGQRLYRIIDRPYLQKDVAERLVQCSAFLRSKDTSLHLLIYDAARPVEVQRKMWEALDSIPPKDRVKFVSNPRNKSLHNFGAAVDLTICRSDRQPLDMGAGFDDIRLIAYPSYEAHFLSTGELTKEQWDNRKLLRAAMRSQKFRNLPTEWWHFNACPRWEAVQKYKLLEKEPATE